MSKAGKDDSAFALIEILKRKAPEYLDIFTAQTDADFEKAFDALLEKSVAGLEANSSVAVDKEIVTCDALPFRCGSRGSDQSDLLENNFASLDEEALSAILALALSTPGLSIIQEAHSNGHVDITITAEHCVPIRKKLGEAKIWDGPEYHIKGVKQLLARYTTGREGRGLVIAYVRKKNIKGLLSKLRDKMNKERPCEQTCDTTDHTLRWSFISAHAHSCGETLEVGHIGCNLYSDFSTETVS